MPNIITISREFGSGGRELGKRLSDVLGYDYYDKEIISEIAKKHKLDEDFVEKTLDKQIWKTIPLNYGRTISFINSIPSMQMDLMIEEKEVLEKIANGNRNCIIVGRNADVLLKKYKSEVKTSWQNLYVPFAVMSTLPRLWMPISAAPCARSPLPSSWSRRAR